MSSTLSPPIPTAEDAAYAKEQKGIEEYWKRNRALKFLFLFLILFVVLVVLVYFFNKRPW